MRWTADPGAHWETTYTNATILILNLIGVATLANSQIAQRALRPNHPAKVCLVLEMDSSSKPTDEFQACYLKGNSPYRDTNLDTNWDAADVKSEFP